MCVCVCVCVCVVCACVVCACDRTCMCMCVLHVFSMHMFCYSCLYAYLSRAHHGDVQSVTKRLGAHHKLYSAIVHRVQPAGESITNITILVNV